MNVNKIDFANIINVGDSYADHLGIAEDVIKKGAQYGLVSDSDAKRALRMLAAQGDAPDGRTPLFAADVLAAPAIMENPQEFKSWLNGLMSKGTKEQQGANAIPGMHGHHGNSVSSIHAAGQNLPVQDHVKMLNEIDRNPEYADVDKMGTHREQMLGIMGPGHLTDEFNAHLDPLKDGVTNTGYWQTGQSYQDEMDPIKRAARAVDETFRPQQALSKAAFNSAINQEAIGIAADALGVTPDELMDVSLNNRGKTQANVNRDALKKEEFDAKGMEKVLYMDRGRTRTGTTSNAGALEDRPGLADNRVRMGLNGNEKWVVRPDGSLTIGMRANNPRRRL